MQIAIGLRTCSSVENYWNTQRFVNASKSTLILTCLNSLLKSIKRCILDGHYVQFSIHDDNSDNETIDKMMDLCFEHGIPVEFFYTDKHRNFMSQYEWLQQQKFDYAYCVEDDYLHKEYALTDMINMCQNMRELVKLDGDFAVYPFNNPHRYNSFEMMYPSFILEGEKCYWRSILHSTHTFFVPKIAWDKYNEIMKYQADVWPSNDCFEDNTINKIWHEQFIKLICPMDSLAYHLADDSQKDRFGNWKILWERNHNE